MITMHLSLPDCQIKSKQIQNEQSLCKTIHQILEVFEKWAGKDCKVNVKCFTEEVSQVKKTFSCSETKVLRLGVHTVICGD